MTLPAPTPVCTLDACRLCSRCSHDRHDYCARIVRCPVDGRARPCRCCGPKGEA